MRARVGVLAAALVLTAQLLQGQATRVDSLTVTDLLARYSGELGMRFGYEAAALPTTRLAVLGGALTTATWQEHRRELATIGVVVEATDDGVLLLTRRVEASPQLQALCRLQIVDEAGLPLPGATLIASDDRGWVADAEGVITVPQSAWAAGLELRYVGMATQRFRAGTPEPRGGRIPMGVDRQQAPEAVILARLSPKPVQPVVSLGPRLKPAAGSFAIPLAARSLEGFGYMGVAGASRLDASSSAPALRGSLPTETLVTIDGLPIYHLDHFFGLFPAVDPQLISAIELHRSHYPPAWGGATGGLLALSTRSPTRDSLTLELSQLAASGAISVERGGFGILLGGRSSLGTLASGQLLRNASVDLDEGRIASAGLVQPGFHFADGYALLRYAKTGTPWSAQLQAFASDDQYDYLLDQARTALGPRGAALQLTGEFSEDNSWRNRGARAELNYLLPAHRLSLSTYRSTYSRSLDEVGATRLRSRQGERLVGNVDNELNNQVVDRQVALSVSNQREATGDLQTDYRWTAGVQFQALSSTADIAIGRRQPLDREDAAAWLHAFTEQGFELGPLEVNAGLRVSQRMDTSRTWISPRIKVAAPLGKAQLTAGYSLTQQALRPLQHEDQFGQSYTLLVVEPATRNSTDGVARNYTLGYTRRWSHFQVGVEAYHRDLSGVLAALSQQVALPLGAELVNLQPNFLSVVGDGEVQGIDTDVRYGRGDWSGHLAYTLARSRRRFAEVAEGTWQRAPDDRRHRLATAHEWQHGHWTFGTAFEWATGLTYVDLNVLSPEAGDRGAADPTSYLRSLPAYERLDLSTHYRFELGQAQLRLGLRIYNAFDRTNVTQRQYVVGVGGGVNRAVAVGTDVGLLGRLLIAEVKFAF